MVRKLIQIFLSVMLLATAAMAGGPRPLTAPRNAPNNTKNDNNSKSVKGQRTDVCKLLTSEDIQSVQGDRVEESKPSQQPSGGLLMSQCLFRTTTPAKSVSLALAQSGKQKPLDFWRQQFHADADARPAKSTAENVKQPAHNAEEESMPRAIAGVGDEAYWVGGPIAGALYVLRHNTFIRVSVGGIRAETTRIEKSIALARVALRRF